MYQLKKKVDQWLADLQSNIQLKDPPILIHIVEKNIVVPIFLKSKILKI